MNKLREFLVKAKQNTYANNKAKETKIKGGGKLLAFFEGNFYYQDKYFGTNPFSGEEIVLQNGKVIWIMNYYGKAKDKKIYDFLKKALMNVNKNKPFRGPEKFSEGNLTYNNKVNGNLSEFSGIETINQGKNEVYKCYYHGGFVK